MDGWKYGSKLGMFVQKINADICWLSHGLRKWKYYRQYIKDRSDRFNFIKKFVDGFKVHYKLSFVKCEACQAVGIDYNSEKHGWKYEGSHIWTCPACKEDTK